MRQAGRRLAEVVATLKESIRPGVTTAELDEIAAREIAARDSKPSFLGYKAGGTVPFPATICASPNDRVVHGFPGDNAACGRRHHKYRCRTDLWRLPFGLRIHFGRWVGR